MIQTLTCTLNEADVPEVVRREALKEGKPLEDFVKEGLLTVARRINANAKRSKARPQPVTTGGVL